MGKFFIAFFAFKLFGDAAFVFQMPVQMSLMFVFSSAIVGAVDGAVHVVKSWSVVCIRMVVAVRKCHFVELLEVDEMRSARHCQ